MSGRVKRGVGGAYWRSFNPAVGWREGGPAVRPTRPPHNWLRLVDALGQMSTYLVAGNGGLAPGHLFVGADVPIFMPNCGHNDTMVHHSRVRGRPSLCPSYLPVTLSACLTLFDNPAVITLLRAISSLYPYPSPSSACSFCSLSLSVSPIPYTKLPFLPLSHFHPA